MGIALAKNPQASQMLSKQQIRNAKKRHNAVRDEAGAVITDPLDKFTQVCANLEV